MQWRAEESVLTEFVRLEQARVERGWSRGPTRASSERRVISKGLLTVTLQMQKQQRHKTVFVSPYLIGRYTVNELYIC